MRIYKHSMTFRIPAMDQSDCRICYNYDLILFSCRILRRNTEFSVSGGKLPSGGQLEPTTPDQCGHLMSCTFLSLWPLQVILLFLVPCLHAFGKLQIISILNSLYTVCAKQLARKYFNDKRYSVLSNPHNMLALEAMMLIYRPPAHMILGNFPDQKQEYHLQWPMHLPALLTVRIVGLAHMVVFPLGPAAVHKYSPPFSIPTLHISKIDSKKKLPKLFVSSLSRSVCFINNNNYILNG